MQTKTAKKGTTGVLISP